MLHALLNSLDGVPAGGPALRAALAALTAAVLALVAGGPILKRLTRLDIREKTEKTPIEDEDLRRTIAGKSGTPTMGGLIILAGLVPAVLLWADLATPQVLGALVCIGALAGLGLIDDYAKLRGTGHRDRGLKVRHKLLFQGLVGAALGLLLAGGTGIGSLLFAAAWAGLVLATMANATNVTDGLDGLLAGLVPPAALVVGGACWAAGTPGTAARLGLQHVPGAAELSVVCAATAGACLGFLRFNHHPARVFMGDTGSMALGGGLAACALGAGQEVVLGLAGLVFLAEFGSSLLQIGAFQLFGKRVLPVAPVHHIFQKQGHHETMIVRGFYLAGMAAAVAGLGWIWV
ncbi:MAG: phospho-N-acetylmuramoyl-pentapeptide-transferase [Candidatus Brocadiia bacterium]